MKIVYLDGYVANPGGDVDADWSRLKDFGDFTVYDRTPADQIVARVKGHDAILTNKVPFDRATMQQLLPELKYIGLTSTGTNIVDLVAAKELGITVTNVPAYSSASVAQHTMALLLELANGVGLYNQSVHVGDWVKSPDFCYYNAPLLELEGMTFGIVGFGDIGQKVARLAHAFGMKIAATTRTPKTFDEFPVQWLSREELFATADVVSLHCPLTSDTKNLVNAASLARMKSSAFFLNTSRGPLVEDAALAKALNEGRLAGAGLDVLSTEPPPTDNPLLTAKNCIITPHIAWGSLAARKRLYGVVVKNLRAFINSAPMNVVNP